jgi:FMN-dependent NADH-azoreductase
MKLVDLFKEKFREPTPMEVVTRELAEATLEKLQAETAVDWAQSVVSYNRVRIERLNEYIAAYSKEKSK